EPGDDPSPAPRREEVGFATEDEVPLRGVLTTPASGSWRTAVLLAHPRGDFSVHYAAPLLAAAGDAALGFGTRYLNNDIDCQHELLVRDVAAAIDEMRRRGANS